MSRIDELIDELCPDGVEHKALGELGEFIRGNGLQKADFVPLGLPCIHYGQIYTKFGTTVSEPISFVPEGLFERLKKAQPGNLVIATTSENFDDVGKAVVWLGAGEVAIGGHAAVYQPTLDPKFVAYFFQTESFRQQKRKLVRGTKVIELYPGELAKVIIPVPPAAVQQEIVRILDTMETLEAELEAELEARRKQYEHYRDSLLNFAEAPPEWNVRWTTLGEVLRIRNGRDFKHLGQGTIPVYGSGGVMAYVSDAAHEGPSVLIPRKGSLSNIYFVNEPFWTVDTIFYTEIDETVLLPKFAYYLLVQMDVEKLNVAGGVPSLNQTVLNRQGLAIPSLEVQARIVSTLDAMSELAEGFESGLPAEIAARRKQYEYYRDKLLTFPALQADAA